MADNSMPDLLVSPLNECILRKIGGGDVEEPEAGLESWAHNNFFLFLPLLSNSAVVSRVHLRGAILGAGSTPL